MSEEYNIQDFWVMKNEITDKKILKEYAREFYTNDFISNIKKWKENLAAINEMMKNELAFHYKFVDQYWEDMPYDYFCKNINDKIENWIESNGDIVISDMYIINDELISDYYVLQIQNMQNKTISLSNILKSIKKTILF